MSRRRDTQFLHIMIDVVCPSDHTHVLGRVARYIYPRPDAGKEIIVNGLETDTSPNGEVFLRARCPRCHSDDYRIAWPRLSAAFDDLQASGLETGEIVP